MAKIFIDTDILPKAFRKLDSSLKIAWFYIWTHCDRAGVWEIDDDLFEFENGLQFDCKKFKEAFSDLVQISGTKILLKDFIKVNYGTLTDNYNPHKPVFRDMAKNNVKLEPSLNQAYIKLVDEDEDKDKEEGKDEKGKVGMGEKPKTPVKHPKPKEEEPELQYLFLTENFRAQWQLWKTFRSKEHNFKYKTVLSEQAALNDLYKLSEGIEKIAIAIIHQSIAKGWKGFFELNDKNNGANKSNEHIFAAAMDSEVGRNFEFK